MTELQSFADFFLAGKSGLSKASIVPCMCTIYVIAVSAAVESGGLNVTDCLMCPQVSACLQTESKF